MTDEANSSLTYNPLVVKGVSVFRLENHQLDAIIVEKQGKTRLPELSKCNWLISYSHSKADCPEPRKQMGTCYNCGGEG